MGLEAKRPQHGLLETHLFVDSDWAACLKTRRSMSGVGAKMSGGPIGYKTRLQTTVAMSSTESKFMVACDAAEDNDGATAMVNVQKPTHWISDSLHYPSGLRLSET